MEKKMEFKDLIDKIYLNTLSEDELVELLNSLDGENLKYALSGANQSSIFKSLEIGRLLLRGGYETYAKNLEIYEKYSFDNFSIDIDTLNNCLKGNVLSLYGVADDLRFILNKHLNKMKYEEVSKLDKEVIFDNIKYLNDECKLSILFDDVLSISISDFDAVVYSIKDYNKLFSKFEKIIFDLRKSTIKDLLKVFIEDKHYLNYGECIFNFCCGLSAKDIITVISDSSMVEDEKYKVFDMFWDNGPIEKNILLLNCFDNVDNSVKLEFLREKGISLDKYGTTDLLQIEDKILSDSYNVVKRNGKDYNLFLHSDLEERECLDFFDNIDLSYFIERNGVEKDLYNNRIFVSQFVKKYLRDNNMECNIDFFSKYESNNGGFTVGLYERSNNTLSINAALLDDLPKSRLISIIFHELRHKLQFDNIGKEITYKNLLYIIDSNCSNIGYKNNYSDISYELDANAAAFAECINLYKNLKSHVNDDDRVKIDDCISSLKKSFKEYYTKLNGNQIRKSQFSIEHNILKYFIDMDNNYRVQLRDKFDIVKLITDENGDVYNKEQLLSLYEKSKLEENKDVINFYKKYIREYDKFEKSKDNFHL